MMTTESLDIAKAAIKLALSNRTEETLLKEELKNQGIKAAAVNFGGDYLNSIRKIIERAIVAAKREGVIPETHLGEGAVAGAAKDALAQISPRAEGFNVGGKIAISCSGEHLSVAIFFGIGLVHLNDVTIGLGHRSYRA